VIAVDTNVLVYAHREDSPHHAAASAVLASLAQGPAPWAVPWPCLHEFLAVVTHPRIYRPPTTTDVALAALAALVAAPNVRVLSETDDHAEILAGLAATPGVVGPRVHDARIAAICLGHGVSELWSADRDFSWFPALRVRNPLARPAD
jgi:toxin-antitoxin system PIN domain toxin